MLPYSDHEEVPSSVPLQPTHSARDSDVEDGCNEDFKGGFLCPSIENVSIQSDSLDEDDIPLASII